MIYLITKAQLPRVWPKMLPGLQRADFTEDISSYSTLEDLYKGVEDGDYVGLYDSISQYSAILQVVDYSKKRVLLCFWGGQPEGAPQFNYEETDQFLTNLAQIYEADVIQIQGRPGWGRKIKHLGYRPETINFYKEVPR